MPALSPAAPVRHHLPARRLVVVLLATLLTATLFAAPSSAVVAANLSTPANKTITKGTSATITTRLTSGGAAVAGRSVTLFSYIGGAWYSRGTVATSATGYATFRYTPTASRTVAVLFRGDSRYARARSANFRITVVTGNAILTEAARHQGKPYQYGAIGPDRFDCSGYTMYVYRRVGKSLPRTSSMQRGATRRIARSERRPGDLIFFHNSSGSVYHVGIYAGSGEFWASPRTGLTVRRRAIWSSSVSYGRL
ncbi:MAG TPA: NlpC/P60 family protein [Mycobacteriales bacterium]|nr:NlpC/P60 family protein [Mycobacteriales bacterium]